jgi:hypothetical protein
LKGAIVGTPDAEGREGLRTPDISRYWPYVLVGLGVLGAGVAAWRPVPAGVWHDDGVYLLTAKALATGEGLVYDGVVGSPPAVKFPPLYPGLLAILWLGLGGIGPVTLVATCLNLGFLAGAAALFAKALHEATGLSARVSGGAALLGFISADVLRTAMVPLSEPLFLLLVMASLALWPRAGPGSARGARIGMAILLVATVATRGAGLAVVGALALALLLRSGAVSAAVVTGPAIAVAAGWGRWAAARSAEIPEGMRDLLGSYGTWFLDQTLSAPVAFLSGLPSHTLGVLERVAAIFLPGLTGWPLLAAFVPFVFVALVGIRDLIDRFPPVGWLVPAYVGMLLLWPYLDRRLVAPIHPVIVAAVIVGAAHLLDRLRAKRARALVIGLTAMWVASYSIVTAARIADGWPTAPYRLRADRLAASVEALGRAATDNSVVGAPEYWAGLHLHGGWTVAPSVRFDPRSVDPAAPVWGTPEEQISLWRAVGIDHLLLEQGGVLQGAALDRLEAECAGTVLVLARMPPLLVVRLVWDSTCEGGS